MSAPLRPLLLVDDEGAFRRGVAEYLSGAGFEVTEASTVAEALEQLEGFAFDVVLTDLRLPDGEGTTVLEAARARYPEIVVLVVTGKGLREEGGRTIDGRIRGEFVGWLNRGDNRERVRAVRAAHAHHGGTGAFYLLLRRRSSASSRSLRATPQR